jgi:hypothetical protein
MFRSWKPFLDKISKNLYKGGTLRNMNFKILSMQCRTSSWLKRLGCRWGTNFCQRRRRRVTDGKTFIAFFHVLWLFIGKKHDLSKKKFPKFWCEINTFNIFHIYDESKKSSGVDLDEFFEKFNCGIPMLYLSRADNISSMSAD